MISHYIALFIASELTNVLIWALIAIILLLYIQLVAGHKRAVQSSRMYLRSIKSLLHNLVGFKGDEIFQILMEALYDCYNGPLSKKEIMDKFMKLLEVRFFSQDENTNIIDDITLINLFDSLSDYFVINESSIMSPIAELLGENRKLKR